MMDKMIPQLLEHFKGTYGVQHGNRIKTLS